MRSLQCTYGQGYYFARPLLPEDLPAVARISVAALAEEAAEAEAVAEITRARTRRRRTADAKAAKAAAALPRSRAAKPAPAKPAPALRPVAFPSRSPTSAVRDDARAGRTTRRLPRRAPPEVSGAPAADCNVVVAPTGTTPIHHESLTSGNHHR